MFKKTRNRIMILNMAMVSAVVVIAFAVIFVTTYTREQESNNAKLMYGPIPHVTAAGRVFREGSAAHVLTEVGDFYEIGAVQRISPAAGLSFSILTDSDGDIIVVNSVVDLPESAYIQAAHEASRQDMRGMDVVLEGRSWRYAVSSIVVDAQESAGIFQTASGDYRDIRFLDVTDSYRMLWSLGLTLAGLSVLIIAVFFFISRYFANRAIRPMEEAWEKQSRFAADASHELKTPLSVINANCGVLYANKDETMESQIKWVDSIMRAADRMAGLVGDLLALAHMEDTGNTLQMAAFDLSAAVAGAVSEMEPAAIEKGLDISKCIEQDIEMLSDKGQITKLLDILMDNAIKYTASGGEISVTLKKEKRHVVCAVRNSGDGIPKEELPRLFDRFYRGDPARSSENGGYGLGLAIARGIAERLDAKLLAFSEPGQYAEFRLLIKHQGHA